MSKSYFASQPKNLMRLLTCNLGMNHPVECETVPQRLGPMP